MNTLRLLVLLVLFLPSIGSSHPSDRPDAPLHDAWTKLAEMTKRGDVKSLDVALIPYNSESLLRVDPESFAKEAEHKCSLMLSGIESRSLSFAVERTVVTPQREVPDVHWGVVFLGARGEILSKLYLGVQWNDKTVDSELDGHRARLNSFLIDWLNKKFQPERWSDKLFTQKECDPS